MLKKNIASIFRWKLYVKILIRQKFMMTQMLKVLHLVYGNLTLYSIGFLGQGIISYF